MGLAPSGTFVPLPVFVQAQNSFSYGGDACANARITCSYAAAGSNNAAFVSNHPVITSVNGRIAISNAGIAWTHAAVGRRNPVIGRHDAGAVSRNARIVPICSVIVSGDERIALCYAAIDPSDAAVGHHLCAQYFERRAHCSPRRRRRTLPRRSRSHQDQHSMLSGEDVGAVPAEVLRSRSQGHTVEKVKFLAVATFQPTRVGAPLREDLACYQDVPTRVDGP